MNNEFEQDYVKAEEFWREIVQLTDFQTKKKKKRWESFESQKKHPLKFDWNVSGVNLTSFNNHNEHEHDIINRFHYSKPQP